MKTCPTCGTQNANENSNCFQCGAPLPVQASADSQGSSVNLNKQGEPAVNTNPGQAAYPNTTAPVAPQQPYAGQPNQPQPGYPVYSQPYPQQPVQNNEPVSVGMWIMVSLVSLIPIVNIVMMIVWATSAQQTSLRNYAKAYWVVLAVVVVLIFLIAGVVSCSAASCVSSYRYYY